MLPPNPLQPEWPLTHMEVASAATQHVFIVRSQLPPPQTMPPASSRIAVLGTCTPQVSEASWAPASWPAGLPLVEPVEPVEPPEPLEPVEEPALEPVVDPVPAPESSSPVPEPPPSSFVRAPWLLVPHATNASDAASDAAIHPAAPALGCVTASRS